MQTIKIFIIFWLISLTGLLNAQTANKAVVKETMKPKEYFEDAEFFYEQEDYREALFNYLRLNELNKGNCNINFRIGMCYLNIPGEEYKAIPYLETAITKISVKYEKSTLRETQAPLHSLFYLGNAYRINNQLDQALLVYNRFRNHPYFENNYNSDMVDNEIEACERAKLIQDNPTNIRIENLGSPVNNANSNLRPVTNADGTTLIYLSSLKFYDAIMLSQKTDTGWTEPDNISPQVGSDGDCEPTWLSADGKTLLLVKKAKGNNDIYMSQLDANNRWSLMKPLNKNINSKWNESAACISPDGKTIYFSSDRRGSIGKLDIYKATLDEAGNWSEATNLGKVINTDRNENYPFICNDNNTLYFSSEGHLNMGGYDIFISSIQQKNKWELPVNAGFPINTTNNDIYYQPLENGEWAFTSLFKKEGMGKEDIYKIENISVKERNNPSSDKPKSQKIMVRDKSNNEVVGVIYSNDRGKNP